MSELQIKQPETPAQFLHLLKSQENRFTKLAARAGHPDPNLKRIYQGKAETLQWVIKTFEATKINTI